MVSQLTIMFCGEWVGVLFFAVNERLFSSTPANVLWVYFWHCAAVDGGGGFYVLAAFQLWFIILWFIIIIIYIVVVYLLV